MHWKFLLSTVDFLYISKGGRNVLGTMCISELRAIIASCLPFAHRILFGPILCGLFLRLLIASLSFSDPHTDFKTSSIPYSGSYQLKPISDLNSLPIHFPATILSTP